MIMSRITMYQIKAHTLNPKIEKMTMLAKMEVPQFTTDTKIASLLQLLWTGL